MTDSSGELERNFSSWRGGEQREGIVDPIEWQHVNQRHTKLARRSQLRNSGEQGRISVGMDIGCPSTFDEAVPRDRQRGDCSFAWTGQACNCLEALGRA